MIVEVLRATEGCRSPYFNALKRRVSFLERDGVGVLVLAEKRELLVPWLRLPVFTYWRLREVQVSDEIRRGVVARTFLETGHVPVESVI